VPIPAQATNLGPGASWIAIASFVALAASVMALIFFDEWVDSTNLFITLPLQIVLGSIVFLTGVTFIVVVFARLNLHNREQALGLPEGSIRALIALILIVIFFIFANSVFGSLQNEHLEEYTGLTSDQVAALDREIVSQIPDSNPNSADPTFSGQYIQAVNDDAVSLGQQLITALITLVAAISAFYFGSNSVKTATDTAVRASAVAGSGNLVVVPKVIGRSVGSARDRLARDGLTSTVARRGSPEPIDRVITQSPEQGAELLRGEAVDLVISAGPAPDEGVSAPTGTPPEDTTNPTPETPTDTPPEDTTNPTPETPTDTPPED
jgi:hypothetical protein